jgi:hypothetical protein
MLDINKITAEQLCDDVSWLLKSGKFINAMETLEKKREYQM